jgi:hypothetical protein
MGAKSNPDFFQFKKRRALPFFEIGSDIRFVNLFQISSVSVIELIRRLLDYFGMFKIKKSNK